MGNPYLASKLSVKLKKELELIIPYSEFETDYYPCDVLMKNGKMKKNVIIVEAQQYINIWGMWPKDDNHKREIKLSDVKSIKTAQNRMPIQIENQLQYIEETGMGYHLFFLKLNSERKLLAQTGNIKFFLNLGENILASDISEILPFDRSVDFDVMPEIFESNYYWCIYSR